MHVLDSRRLGPQNCYICKIKESGDLAVTVQKAAAGYVNIDDEKTNMTKVRSRSKSSTADKSEREPCMVPLCFKDNAFEFDVKGLKLQQGDSVLFYLSERNCPDFAVMGQIGKSKFNSTSLIDQVVFTHAFGLPGRYEWADANGSGIGGIINVVDEPGEGKRGAERAVEALSEGAVVHIVSKKVSPKTLTITTGQTVFFAVEETDGITITDVNLLPRRNKGKKQKN